VAVGEGALVSVVIPTYNNAEMAPEAVASALAQEYRPIEVIVVDDGSTDETADRLGGLGSDVRVVRLAHGGPAVARNAGIRESSGELVAFLDSDDLWMPGKLSRCVGLLAAHPEAGVVYTGVMIVEVETGRRYLLEQYAKSGWMARDLFLECRGVNTSTLVVRRRCLEAVGGFDEEFFRAQDWDLMIRLAERFEYVHEPEALTERRLHGRSLSVTHAHLYKKYNLLVLEKALARRPDLYGDLQERAYSLAHLRFGLQHYGEFRMAEARGEFRESLSHEWNGRAFDYMLRTYLPRCVVRGLRKVRLALQSRGREGRVEGGVG